MRKKIAIFITIYIVTLAIIFAATSLSTISADTTTKETTQNKTDTKEYVVYPDNFTGPLPPNSVTQSNVKPDNFTGTLAPNQVYQKQVTASADYQGKITKNTTIFGTNLDEWMANFYTWSIAIGGALAILVIVWAAYEYATSAGEVEKINKAKEKIVGAILGLILLVLVALILEAVGSRGTITNPFKGITGGNAPGSSTTNNKSVNNSGIDASSGWVTGSNDSEGMKGDASDSTSSDQSGVNNSSESNSSSDGLKGTSSDTTSSDNAGPAFDPGIRQ